MNQEFFIGVITPWRITVGSAGHSTWHYALSCVDGFDVCHFGLKDNNRPDWIQPVFGKSLDRYIQSASPKSIRSLISRINKHHHQSGCVTIFEGSMYWAFVFLLLSKVLPSKIFICNLWPSYKYLELSEGKGFRSQVFKLSLKLLNRRKNLVLTVDTQALARKINSLLSVNLENFPVPTSLSFREVERKYRSHWNVLVNNRGIDFERLYSILQESCQQCTFHIPYNKSKYDELKSLFQYLPNIDLGDKYIGDAEFENYIDSFDHSIFLYTPIPMKKHDFSHFCASGKLLDVLVRQIPVSLPVGGEEWISIAMQWGRYSIFNIESNTSIVSEFNHPKFSGFPPKTTPNFTPYESLKRLERIYRTSSGLKDTSKSKSFYSASAAESLIVQFAIALFWLSASIISLFYSLMLSLKAIKKWVIGKNFGLRA